LINKYTTPEQTDNFRGRVE